MGGRRARGTAVGPAVDAALVETVRHAGGRIAGSLIAVPAGERLAVAGALGGAGLWAHADVIDGEYGDRPSASVETIADVVATEAVPVDVHLMVTDVAGWLRRLPAGVRRITVQEPAAGIRREDLDTARSLAEEVWLAVLPERASSIDTARADGVLVMLTPPGAAGHTMDQAGIDHVARAAARTDLAAVGVDGGVDRTNVGALLAAGARYLVSGRGLLG